VPVSVLSISFTFDLNEAGMRRRYGTLQPVLSANRRDSSRLPPRGGQPIDIGERREVG